MKKNEILIDGREDFEPRLERITYQRANICDETQLCVSYRIRDERNAIRRCVTSACDRALSQTSSSSNEGKISRAVKGRN